MHRRLLTLTLLLGLIPTVASGRQDTGTLTGTITDPSGAVLPNVGVVARERQTGVATSTVSNARGVYVITPLHIGVYVLEAELSGFRKSVRRDVRLHVGDRARIDFELTLGSVLEEVVVESAPPLLQPESSSLDQVIENRAIEELPVKGRNFQSLAVLSAGVTPAIGHRDQAGGFNANGNRALQNNFLIDGIDNNSINLGLQNRAAQVLIPSLDAVSEFKVTTSSYGAEVGRNAGAVMSVSIKSGTNALHGSAFEYFRHDMFDARDFFNYEDRDGDGHADPEHLRRHQFGGTLGGPIVRNRSFFFGSWERTAVRVGLVDLVIVPTADERLGLFDPERVGRVIRDPLTGAPFPDNTIPPNRIDPVAAKLVALYPMPNFSGPGRRNFSVNPPGRQARDQFDFRVDHRFSDRDQAFVRVSFMDEDQRRDPPLPAPLLGPDTENRAVDHDVAHSFTASETHTFGTRVINEFRLGLSRLRTDRLPLSDAHLNEEFGIRGIPRLDDVPGLPLIQLAGAVSYGHIGVGSFTPNLKLSQTLHLMDSVTIVLGGHSLKVGADFRRFETNLFGSAQARGRINYNGRYTGVSLADFLLGWANVAELSTPQVGDLRGWSAAAYIQEDWKVSSRLSVNAGLRYELQTPFWDTQDRQSNFITDPGHSGFGTLLRAGARGRSLEDRSLVRLDTNNWAPRVGFAWEIAPKTLLRGAGGIFYGGPENVGAAGRLLANPPFFRRVTRIGTAQQAAIILSTGFPAGFLGDPDVLPRDVNVNSWAVDFPITQVSQWMVNVQRELPRQMLLSLAYVGNTGQFLTHAVEYNTAGIGDPATERLRRPFPEIGSIQRRAPWARSTYNSLQARVDKRLSRGFSLLASYTWSHALDNANEPFGQEMGVSTPWDHDNDWASASFDVRQRFVTSVLAEIPAGRGRRWLGAAGGLLDGLFGGWQISSILAVQSGLPFTPQVSGSLNRLGTLGVELWRPDQLRAGTLPSSERSAERWFDPSAFAVPCEGLNCRLGNAGRNILRSSGFFALDLSLMKTFRIAEGRRLQFRWEAFNATNTPFLGEPNATIDSPEAGIISTTRGDPRQMQFSLRLLF